MNDVQNAGFSNQTRLVRSSQISFCSVLLYFGQIIRLLRGDIHMPPLATPLYVEQRTAQSACHLSVTIHCTYVHEIFSQTFPFFSVLTVVLERGTIAG